ncbi:MAG: hypothetical protein V1672_01915 [Candidatus Diapherotrites archaeon]
MAETYIVKSKIADYIRSQNMMMSKDAYESLSAEVESMLSSSIKRCKENGRKTVKSYDF